MNILNMDLSAIEARIAAHVAEPKAGEDLYTNLAAEMLKVSPQEVTPTGRRVAKKAAFFALYHTEPHPL